MTYTHFKYFSQFVKIDVPPILRVFKSPKVSVFNVTVLSLYNQSKIFFFNGQEKFRPLSYLEGGRVCTEKLLSPVFSLSMASLNADSPPRLGKIDTVGEECYFLESENSADYEFHSLPGNPIPWLGDGAVPEALEFCALVPSHLITP